jgi:bacterial/archaeal transporter family-2 protein
VSALDGLVEPRVARGRRRALAVGAAVSAGVGLAAQARLNGELGARLGDGVAASLASTTAGLVVLLVLVPALPSGRRGLRSVRAELRAGGLRWWHCCGGVGGALFVASQGISVGALGVAVFTVAIVAGSAIGGLGADRWGLGPGGRHRITSARAGGALACIAAVAVAVSDRLGGQGTVVLVILPLLAGIAVATQSALNGRVGAAARSPWPATLVSFAVAEATLAAVVLVGLAVRGAPVDRLPAEPWLYAAGVIGIVVIATAARVVGQVGVLVFSLASVAGQLLGALALDALTAGPRPTVAVWIGTAVTFGAVALAARPGRRPDA